MILLFDMNLLYGYNFPMHSSLHTVSCFYHIALVVTEVEEEVGVGTSVMSKVLTFTPACLEVVSDVSASN